MYTPDFPSCFFWDLWYPCQFHVLFIISYNLSSPIPCTFSIFIVYQVQLGYMNSYKLHANSHVHKGKKTINTYICLCLKSLRPIHIHSDISTCVFYICEYIHMHIHIYLPTYISPATRVPVLWLLYYFHIIVHCVSEP